MNHAASMIKDITNLDYEMFHSKKDPPVQAQILTGFKRSAATEEGLMRITEMLLKFVPVKKYKHIEGIAFHDGEGNRVLLSKDTLILRLRYKEQKPRKLTFHLSKEKATLTFH
jgi:hypothetical protein